MLDVLGAIALIMAGLQIDAVAPEDRSGPSRQVRCVIDGKIESPCRFTPLFGDGSFNIELPDQELRVIVEGEGSFVFAVFGPARRVPLLWRYHRDKQDRACWVSDEADRRPRSICVY